MSAIALVTDLIFATKIKSTADELGVPLSLVRTAQALEDAAGSGLNVAIIDLNAEGLDPVDAIRRCKAKSQTLAGQTAAGPDDVPHVPVIIAFASHVQRELIHEAENAGADLVLPRSRFSAELASLLERYGQMRDYR